MRPRGPGLAKAVHDRVGHEVRGQVARPAVVIVVVRLRPAAAPTSGGQDLSQFLKAWPQVSEPLDDVHGGEAADLTAAFQFMHEVNHRPLAQRPQRLLVSGRQMDEPGYQGGEDA